MATGEHQFTNLESQNWQKLTVLLTVLTAENWQTLTDGGSYHERVGGTWKTSDERVKNEKSLGHWMPRLSVRTFCFWAAQKFTTGAKEHTYIIRSRPVGPG